MPCKNYFFEPVKDRWGICIPLQASFELASQRRLAHRDRKSSPFSKHWLKK